MAKPTWHPSADILTLKQRANFIERIRNFFKERDVLEVETPTLSHATVTDPYIQSFSVIDQVADLGKVYYLQTSPEFAMKRLLAAGSGSIYQISKSFRHGEKGRLHNPEFTMLEWYRTDFDHHQLMDEIDLFLKEMLAISATERLSYAKLFEDYAGINPHHATVEELKLSARDINYASLPSTYKKDWLDLLFTHKIEPYLGQELPLLVYDFPKELAALSKIRHEDLPIASRFEVYFKGIEIANGFHELLDVEEQRDRFDKDNTFRKMNHMNEMPIDEFFLEALTCGLPPCSGVALGVDRLLMLALGYNTIADVISFVFDRA